MPYCAECVAHQKPERRGTLPGQVVGTFLALLAIGTIVLFIAVGVLRLAGVSPAEAPRLLATGFGLVALAGAGFLAWRWQGARDEPLDARHARAAPAVEIGYVDSGGALVLRFYNEGFADEVERLNPAAAVFAPGGWRWDGTATRRVAFVGLLFAAPPLCLCGGPVALGLGIWAMRNLRQLGETDGRLVALAAIVLGALGSVVSVGSLAMVVLSELGRTR